MVQLSGSTIVESEVNVFNKGDLLLSDSLSRYDPPTAVGQRNGESVTSGTLTFSSNLTQAVAVGSGTTGTTLNVIDGELDWFSSYGFTSGGGANDVYLEAATGASATFNVIVGTTGYMAAPFTVQNTTGTMSVTGWVQLTQSASIDGTDYSYIGNGGVLSMGNGAILLCNYGFYLSSGSVQMAANNTVATVSTGTSTSSTFYLNGTINLSDDNTALKLISATAIDPTDSFTLNIGFDGDSPYDCSQLAWYPIAEDLTFTLTGSLVLYNVDDNLPTLDQHYYVVNEISGGNGSLVGAWSSISCPTIPNAQWGQGSTNTSDYVYVDQYTSNVIHALVAAPGSDQAPTPVIRAVPALPLPPVQAQREALDSIFAGLAWSSEQKEDSGALLAV